MDEELRQLALQALKNAFFLDFSALVNGYLKMAADLDVEGLEAELASISVYGRSDDGAVSSKIVALGENSDASYRTMVGALKARNAYKIFIGDKLVFERDPSEIGMIDKWMFKW